MGRVCKGTGEKEGHIGARYRIHTIRRQENHLAIKYLALLCVCMLQETQCAKLLSLTTVKLIFLGNHPSVGV